MASNGVAQDAVSLQGSCRIYPSGILTTLEIHLLFVTEAVSQVMGVSDEYWGEVLR
jgi:hypothetical protein